MTRKTTLRLWQPPGETLEAIAEVLMSHWQAAKAHPERLFWPGPASWLGGSHHFTSGGRLMRYASGSASVLNPNFVPRS
jgi:hypothetical protein